MTAVQKARPDLDLLLSGEALLLDHLAAEPPDPAAPSALPGWTTGHLLAHLTGNAQAVGRLLTWARTGVETPMYTGPDARARQIESDRTRPARWLCRELSRTSAELLEAALGLTADEWRTPVRSALGRDIPASEVPWMRARESHIHLIDLRLGFGFADLPAAFTVRLLDEAVAAVGARPDCPPLLLIAEDRGGSWRLGPPAEKPQHVHAPAAELLAWVLGRDRPPGRPALPRWL